METHAEEASKAVTSATRRLQNALKQNEPEYASLEPLLEKLRVRSGNLALLYLALDRSAEDVENRLWNFHVEVSGKFKLWLKGFREGDGKRKHVERRKAEKLYVDFIRASQRYYRAYIGRLTANFSNIPKVFEIAEKLNQNGLTAQSPKIATQEQNVILEKSCKLCIIRLGDLSRWRETELQLKERNWGPAKGYYQLALSMDPGEGTCYNQLAVIARNDEDHLGAVYYLYRATAVTNPFPTAADNIKAEFEKLLTLRTEESYALMDRSGDDMVSSLEKRFLAFHAHSYARPYDFVAFQQRAKDILGMVALCFADQDARPAALDHFLQRACLINIAAEDLARRGMTKNVLMKKLSESKLAREADKNCQSYFLFQRFNLMTFRDLLSVLKRELGDPPTTDQDLSDLSRLSLVVRRVLPHLRQYSSWLLSHMRELVETKFKSTRLFLEGVMRTYAETLNLLRSHVDVFAPSQVGYLLEDDERTLSFPPYSPKVIEWRYYGVDKTKVKPTRFDSGRGKEISEELAETHMRATDLVVDALRLVKQQDDLGLSFVPLEIVETQFVALQIPDSAVPQAPPSPPKQVWKSRTHVHTASMNGVDSPSRPASANLAVPVVANSVVATPEVPSTRAQANGDQDRLNLTSSETMQTAVEEPSATFASSSILMGTPAAPASGQLTAMDIVRRMQQRSSGGSPVSQRSPDSAKKHVQPSLPSVYNTPFAPTPNEQAQLSPRLDTNSKPSSSFTSPSLTSSTLFQDQLAQQQRDVQLRSSYQAPFEPTPSWSTYGQTPTGMNTFLRAFENKQERTPSPFSTSNDNNGRSPQPPRSTSQPPAPFGVIGQARPFSSGTPTNGQG